MSSVPTFTPGADPRNVAGPLWDDGQLWDVRHGVSAWRPIGGIAARPGAMKAYVVFSPPHVLTFGPEKGGKQFTLLTNSVIMAAGHAQAHRGLQLAINGNGKPGELLISLVRNTGSVKTEEEFSHTLKYGPTNHCYRIELVRLQQRERPRQASGRIRRATNRRLAQRRLADHTR